MTEEPKRPVAVRWKPGQSGNPLGRPQGSRNKLSEEVLATLANDWAAGGAETVARVRATDPSTYLRVVASILPKDVLVNVAQATPGNLAPEEWAVMVDLVRLIKAAAPTDAQALPSDLAPALEDAVRAHFAKPVDGT